MHTMFDDSQLLTALKTGEQNAYTIVYKRFARQLCFFVESLTDNTQQAEDITAESFIKTFQKIPEFQTLAGFKSYLFTVAKNASLNYIKTEKIHRAGDRSWAHLTEQVQESAEKQLLQSEVMRVIYEEIENLPGQVKEVIKLTVSQGKSIREIADLMNISYKTVQNHKTRGVNLIRISLLKNNMLTLAMAFSAIHILLFAVEE